MFVFAGLEGCFKFYNGAFKDTLLSEISGSAAEEK